MNNRVSGVSDAGVEMFQEPVLDFCSTIVVPETTVEFVAHDKFVRGLSADGGVLIGNIGQEFTWLFLIGPNLKGKIEPPKAGTMLHSHTLRRASTNSSVINALGGQSKVEITLADMFYLMGCGNALSREIAGDTMWVKDAIGCLRAVHLQLLGPGWFIGSSFDDLDMTMLRAGSRIVSPSLMTQEK